MSGPIIIAVVSLLIGAPGAPADEEPANLERFDARAAVQYGNEQLLQGDAPQALEAYEHAEGLRPDALEIPFVKGLGHYALGEYEPAREAFEKAALSKRRKLADDATYSVGTTFHAEALEGQAEPQLAIEKLENALQRYQSVLASQPDHAPARDAIVKAASMRRQLKRMLEQQQQQQQNQDQDQQNNEDNPDDQQQQQQGQDQNQEDEQEQSESQQEQSADESEDQQNQQQSAQQNEEQEDKSAQQQEDDERREMQESQAEQQEQNSREQAQRRLREMMQNIQERQKRRREKPQPFRVVPVDKDW